MNWANLPPLILEKIIDFSIEKQQDNDVWSPLYKWLWKMRKFGQG